MALDFSKFGTPVEQSSALDFSKFGTPVQPPPEKQSAFRQIADVPLGIAKGAVQGVRMIADAFGAGSDTSKTIKSAETYLADLMSAQAKNDQQEISRIMKDAEDKGVLDQVKAGIKAFTVAPVDTLSSALGTAAPVIAGALGAKILGAGALVGTGVSALTGAGMGAGTVKGAIYEETKKALEDAGASKEDAERRAQLAQQYNGKNLDQILLGTVLGGAAAVGPLEKGAAGILARRILGKTGVEATESVAEQAAKGALRRRAEAGLLEAVPEAVQAGQEQVAQNIALQREGFDVPTFRGAVGSATLEAIAGGGLGAALGGGKPEVAPAPEPAPAPKAPDLEAPRTGPLTPEEQLELDRQRALARRPKTTEELLAETGIQTGRTTTAEDIARIRDEHETAVIEGLLAQDAEMKRANELAALQREQQRQQIQLESEAEAIAGGISDVDRRVREGRIFSSVQDLIDRNIPFASTAISDINQKFGVINEAPLTEEERARIENIMGMVNTFTNFVNLPVLAPKPVDRFAENQAMEALIKERTERGPTEPLRAAPPAPSPRIEEAPVSQGVGEGATLRPTSGVEPSAAQDRQLVTPAPATPVAPDRAAVQSTLNTLNDGDTIVTDDGDRIPVARVVRNKAGNVTAIVTTKIGEEGYTGIDFDGLASLVTPQPYIDSTTGERKFSAPATIEKPKAAAPSKPPAPKPPAFESKIVSRQPAPDGMEVHVFTTTDGYGTGLFDADAGQYVDGSITRFAGADTLPKAENKAAELLSKATPAAPAEPSVEPLGTRKEAQAFGKAIGATQPYPGELRGRVNLPAQKAAKEGNFQGVLSALEKSKNVIVSEIAKRAKSLGTKIVIDDNAEETYTGPSALMRQMSIDGAKMHLEALNKIRDLAPQVDALPDGAPLNWLGFTIRNEKIKAIDNGKDAGSMRLEDIAKMGHSMFAPLSTGPIDIKNKEDFKRLQKAYEDLTSEYGENALQLTSTGSAQMTGVAGAYDAGADTIRVPEYSAKREDVLAHEIVHAQTVQAIASPTLRQKPIVARLNKLYEHVKKELEGKPGRAPYGIQSIQEFVAEGMGNPAFQFLLKKIKYENTSAWDSFVQTIANLIGVKRDTAFTELLSIYSDLTTEQKAAPKAEAPAVEATAPKAAVTVEPAVETAPPKAEAPAAPAAPKQPAFVYRTAKGDQTQMRMFTEDETIEFNNISGQPQLVIRGKNIAGTEDDVVVVYHNNIDRRSNVYDAKDLQKLLDVDPQVVKAIQKWLASDASTITSNGQELAKTLSDFVEGSAAETPAAPKAEAPAAPPTLDTSGIKEVKGRHPQVQAAAQLLQDKKMTREEFEKYVDYYKPIQEVEAEKLLPPTSEQRMNETVNADKRDKINVPVADGTKVGLRMDLPARDRGGSVVSIHEGKPGKLTVGKLMGFRSTGWLKDVTFEVRSQEKGLAVATGAAKAPQQTVEGTWFNLGPEETYSRVKELMKDPAWTQVGFDPSRHGYFYDRKTREPVVSASEMYQVGQFLLAKNVKYAPKTDFLYSLGKEQTKQLQDFQQTLRNLLNKFGLKDVGLNIEEGMRDAGSYSQQLIRIASDEANPIRTLRHEAIHALRELGFFTDAQWNSLSKMAKDKWIDQYLKQRNEQGRPLKAGEESRYDAYMREYNGDMEKITEEAVADAFADFDATKPPAGMLQALLKRMKDLFQSIKSALTKVESPEQIFGKVERGELKPGEKRQAGERKSLSGKRSTQEVARIFGQMVKRAEKELSSALFNWNDSRLNEDKDKIVVYPGRDQRFVRGKEGGKSNVSKAEFIDWLMSDAPFDTSVYGEEITRDAEWNSEIETLRSIVTTPDIRKSLGKATDPGQQALETIRNMGMDVPKPDPTKLEKAKDIWTKAKEDPKLTAQSAARAMRNFLDKVETWSFSSDAKLNNDYRRAIVGDIKQNEGVIGQLLEMSQSQAVHADALASQFMIEGGLKYNDELKKWESFDAKANFPALSKKLDEIGKKYNLSKEQIERVAHAYLVAKRLPGLIERNRQLDEEIAAERATAKPDKKKIQDLEDKKVFISDRQLEQMEPGLSLGKTIPELNQVVNMWNDIRKNTIDVMVNSGLWSPEYAQAMWDNMDYVPYFREDQIENEKGPQEFIRGLQVKSKEFQLKGSEDAVHDVFDNMIRWTQYAINRSVRAHKALQMIDNSKDIKIGDRKMAEKVTEEKRGMNIVRVFRDGKQELYDMADPLYVQAFAGIQNVSIPTLKFMSKISDVLRNSVVLYPLFSVAQVPQDSFAAMFTSGLKTQHALKIPYLAVKEFVKTLARTSQTHEVLKKFGATGVRDFSATVIRDDAEIYAGLKPPRGGWGKTKEFLSHISMAADNAVRQAVYEASIQQGVSRSEAIEKAFEVINFRRKGTSKMLNILGQTVPFFYAYLSAQRVAYKVLTGVGISPTDRAEAFKTLAMTSTAVATLSMLYAMANADDEDYMETPANIRDRTITIPGSGGVRIPLRPDFFLFPKIIAEHTYLLLSEQGYQDAAKFRTSMKDALISAIASPTPFPTAIKPAIEVAINYDFFQGKPLIGNFEKQKDLERQFRDSTSEFAKLLGQTGMISPIAADHLIRGMFGSFGGLFLFGTNQFLHSDPDVPRPEMNATEMLAALPGTSGLLKRPQESALKNDFYTLRDEVEKAVNTFNDIKTRSPEGMEAFLADEKQMARLMLGKSVDKINRELSKIRRQITIVTNMPESQMSAEDKADFKRQLMEMERELLRSVNVKELREMAKI